MWARSWRADAPPALLPPAQADARMVRTRRRATPAQPDRRGRRVAGSPVGDAKCVPSAPALHPRKTPRRNHAAQTPTQVVWPWGPAQRIDPPSGSPRASDDGADRVCVWSGYSSRFLKENPPCHLGHIKKSGAPSLGPLRTNPVSSARALTIFENCQDPRIGRLPAPRLA